MKFKSIIIALCFLIVGCGGTWFPRQSNFGKQVQTLSSQERQYHRKASARVRQGCVASTSYLQPQIGVTIYQECVNRGSSLY